MQALSYYDAAIASSPQDESAYINRAITKVSYHFQPTVVTVQLIPWVVCPSVCLWCWCIVAKWLSGLSWFWYGG